MKKDGLAFGNLLCDRDGQQRPIVSVGIDGVAFFKFYLNGTDKDGRKTAIVDNEETLYDLISPIPLDDQVLVDFKFEMGIENGIKTATLGKFRLWKKENWGCWVFVTGSTHSGHNGLDIKLPYIHLLQNLYFILYGEILGEYNIKMA